MRARLSLATALALGGLLTLSTGCTDERSVAPTDLARPTPNGLTAAKGGGGGGGGGGGTTPTLAVRTVSVSPTTVVAGAVATGRVTLTGAAPVGGQAVSLVSSDVSVASVSPSVTVAAGDSVATFSITSHPVAFTLSSAISANAGQVTQTAVLTVTPAGVTIGSLAVSPAFVAGGQTATGTATLTGAAPAGGAVVTLSTGDVTRATVPPNVMIPAGATSATFAITAGTVASASSVSIGASYGGVSLAASLIVTPPAPTGAVVTGLTINPDLVVGGVTTQGTVTLASATGSPTTVTLSSTDVTVATVAASVTVPAGATTATFPIATRALPANSNTAAFALIVAQAGGASRSASLTTTPPPTGPFIASVTFAPTRVGGGGPATGLVTMNGPATQGAVINLTSSRPDIVRVPAQIVVSANATTSAFPITTSAVSANVAVTITATTGGGGQGSATGTFTVTTDPPPAPDVVRVDAASFQPGGRGGTLSVKATSTSANAILTVFRDAATEATFVLTNKGGGKYEGSFSFSGAKPATVTVRSDLGGVASAAVK